MKPQSAQKTLPGNLSPGNKAKANKHFDDIAHTAIAKKETPPDVGLLLFSFMLCNTAAMPAVLSMSAWSGEMTTPHT